ncbi:hypothetical protein [Tumebacillus avium]|uniref:hypothetical protein n=1 Tax=Tumebacillus avium TaxID=1903704 RepID=UPI0012FDEFC9|nr:hypothetical protein [Tumebacillus avium]
MRRKRFLIVVFLLCATTVSGCSNQGEQVPFEILLNGVDRAVWFQDTADPGALYVPLASKEDLASYVTGIEERQKETPFPPAELKQIEFDQEVGVYLTQGHKGFQEYWVEVERIEKQGQQVSVLANVTQPKGAAADMSSYRVTLLKLKKSDLPHGNVKFVFYDQDGKVLAEKSVTL